MNTSIPAEASASPLAVGLRQLAGIVAPWRWVLVVVAFGVFLGTAAELAPPLLLRQVVDEHDGGEQRQDLFDVERIDGAAVGRTQLARRNPFEPDEQISRARPLSDIGHADHDAGATLRPAPTLGQHRERRSHAWRGAQVDPKLAARHTHSLTLIRCGRERG